MFWYIIFFMIGIIVGWALCAVMANSKIEESLLEQLIIKEDIIELLHVLKTYSITENNVKTINEIEAKLKEL